MGTITKAYVSSNILVGPANLYLGVPPPSSHTPPTQADEIALDANGQPATATTTVTSSTNASPIVVTVSSTTFGSYTLKNGDIVSISGHLVNTNANGTWTISSVTSTTFALVGSTGNGVGTSSGNILVGQHLGLTEGPTTLSVTPHFNEIRADQFESPIDAYLTKVEAEIDTVLLEYDPLTFQRWFSADTVTNPALLANSRITTFGGQFTDASNLRTLMLVSPDRATVGRWIYVFAFRAYIASAIPLTFHRTAANTFKLKWKLVADFSRQPGDELLHQVRTR